MKYLNYTLLAFSVLMVAFNTTKVSFETPFAKDSLAAIIVVLAAMCIVTLNLKLLTSKLIERKYYNLP